MAIFRIRGGRPLTGTHRTPGNKNAALPMLAATVLTDEPVTLTNVPLINDVRMMLRILSDLGADVTLKGHTVTVCNRGIRTRTVPKDLCAAIRASILLAGPMAARHGSITLHAPGGDVIGRRRLDTHLDALCQLGIAVAGEAGTLRFTKVALCGAELLLDEASVTATENAVMAAVLAPGQTVIFNAACEPHVQALCNMLAAMGAGIRGIGTNRLEIDGVAGLHGTRQRIPPDYVDAASFVAAAAVTGGSLTITDAPLQALRMTRKIFTRLGVSWNEHDATIEVTQPQRLLIQNDHGAAIPKIEDGIWPAFPSDLMSLSIVLATQATGTMLFFEKLFESRMYFVDRLIEMGARIVQCDPHRVIVAGPSRLHGTRLSSPDIRAGVSLLLAALAAEGESTVGNADIIDRGYEGIDRELRRLGADIKRED